MCLYSFAQWLSNSWQPDFHHSAPHQEWIQKTHCSHDHRFVNYSFYSLSVLREECSFHKLDEFMTFQRAYLAASAWTGPDGMLPVNQSVATWHFTLSNKQGPLWWRQRNTVYIYCACTLYTSCVSVCRRWLESALTFPIPGFSFTLDTARSRHGGAGGGETCRIPLKLVG